MIVNPGSGALVDVEWDRAQLELNRQQDERIKARAEEREAAARAAVAERATELEQLKREVIAELRDTPIP
jgi:hypothetical protein